MTTYLIIIINLLVFVFAAFAIKALEEVKWARAVIVAAALIGFANAYAPPLVALREALPVAQPIMIFAIIGLLLGFALPHAGKIALDQVNARRIIAFHGWRLVFGSLLLVAGLLGALPPGFFLSVAIGDMVAGIWAISIWRRQGPVSKRELILWSLIGLADLLHVLPRAFLTLPPFYTENPDVFRPVMLPLLGVPMLIALHIILLRRFVYGQGLTAISDTAHKKAPAN